MPAAEKPEVSIVMSQRERFGLTRRSLESMYAHADCTFEFICVDGDSPASVRDYLREESKRRDFTLIRRNYFLTPNEARNIGLAQVTTPYVVFVDNDVIFTPNWLRSLIRCANETQADIVTPVICFGEPVHTNVHFAGGEARIVEEDGRRIFHQSHHFAGKPLAETYCRMVRQETELAEFHCVLVRTAVFHHLGPLDERLTAVNEHVDLCLGVRKHGGKVVFEPSSVVTYIAQPPPGFRDSAYYCYRWCDEFARGSERYFHEKWGTEFNDNVYRNFVAKHQLRNGLRQRLQAFIGWRASVFLYRRYADWMTRAAMRRRSRSMAAEPKVAN